jgi:hypothetical protein
MTTDVRDELLRRLKPMLWQDSQHRYALTNYITSVASMFELINYLIRDDLDTGAPGWSHLVDGNYCPDSLLPWLAQISGVQPEVGETPDALRARILHNEAFNRGTVQALYDAAARQGATLVLVEQRYNPGGGDDPWHVRILLTPSQDTPAAEEAVTAALPAGITVEYGHWAGIIYQDVKDDNPTYQDAKNNNATYRDLRGG